MPIDFFHPKNKNSYATRTASPEWKQWVRAILDPRGVNVADIGCGGGIYSRALAEVGAQVTGVDSSPVMLEAAREQSQSFPRTRWVQGSAEQTGLPDGSFHFLLIRAVTHHLRDLSPCFGR
jgi:2-polyprenyl-3-methyl-5-hydroxy-6-metoxy-1,4-benzoquinol methylase